MTDAPQSVSTATADDFAALREVEVAWLSNELSRAIKNLAYPVGMGIAPQEYHVEAAAKALFERYAKMIEMARGVCDAAQGQSGCGAEEFRLLRLWFEQQIENAQQDQISGFAGNTQASTIRGERAHARHCAMFEALQMVLASIVPPQPLDPAYSSRDSLIEECAQVAEAEKKTFLSPEYASNQPFGSLCERFACDQVAKAIRALSIPSTSRETPNG